MIGIYFSGTGNTKYCIEQFLHAYDPSAPAISMEAKAAVAAIQSSDEIVLAYPVYFSNLPKIWRDFIDANASLWQGKKIFIIATMGLFSGDGCGVLARLLASYGAQILGGLHIQMPDCIADEKMLKRSLEENRQLVKNAQKKSVQAALEMKQGKIPQDGLSRFAHLAGLFGQRLYFYHKTKKYSDRLRIDKNKCCGCGSCVSLCPMKNIKLVDQLAVASNQCTMCYRCIAHCPKQAITLLGKHVVEQSTLEKYQ